MGRVRRALPAGRALPEEQWRRRHRAILALLWLHAVGLTVFALARGKPLAHSLSEGSIVAAIAVIARHGSRRVQSAAGALGLVVASAVFVHLSGGVIEVHFHFFVMVAVLTLYQEWLPFLMAIGFVVVQHGVAGALDSHSVYNHYAAQNNPWKWAAIHGTFVLAASVASLVTWRMNEEARVEAEDAFRQSQESEKRFRSYFTNAAVGQAMNTIDGRFLVVNEAYCHITGYSEAELLARDLHDITHPDDAEETRDRLGQLLRGEVDAYDIEKRYLKRDGDIVHVLNSVSLVRDDDGNPQYLTAVTQDVTERKRAEDALLHQAFHDGLTGLPNRALFIDRLQQALARKSRRDADIAVLFLDIDRFKLVNDSLGHAAGDQLVRAVGERLRIALRPGDTVARFGGDEFVVICEDLTGELEAVAIAERLVSALANPFEVDGRELRLTVSIGIAFAGSGTIADDLLRDADAAMYRAKERGRDRIELFDEEMRARAMARLETETALRRAIENGDLDVHYQPIVELATGGIVGVEALVRWHDPVRGDVSPVEFIPLAEESGLIDEVGSFVLDRACRQVAAWNSVDPERPDLSLSVNLSVRQLERSALVDLVADVLLTSGLPADRLCLEITETALLADGATSLAALDRLKALGVQLAVDDFGTGYASLRYLRQFPVDQVKIDRSFVAGLGESPADGAIVGGVLGLARTLGLGAVAEGVETAGQAEELAILGCRLAQGFRWAQPMAADEMGRWLDGYWAAHGRRPRSSVPQVVIADDDGALRRVLRAALELHGFEVVGEAANGREAVDLARRHQPQLVVLDLTMPGVGGIEALSRIREAAPAARVAILSATDAREVRPDDLAGVSAWFAKDADLSRTVDSLAALTASSSGRTG